MTAPTLQKLIRFGVVNLVIGLVLAGLGMAIPGTA